MHAHVEVLVQHKYLDKGVLINIGEGTTRTVPIIRKLAMGRNGKMVATGDWMEVTHCPICGEPLDGTGDLHCDDGPKEGG